MNKLHDRVTTSRWMLMGLIALTLSASVWGMTPSTDKSTSDRVSPDEAIQYADALSVAFEHAADAIRPSLVTIKSVKHFKPAQQLEGQGSAPDGFPLNDDFLRRFFGQRFQQQMPTQEGLGSGVIVSDNGYILTNNHVVADADEVTVMLADGHELPATVVGADPMSDLAVVQIHDQGLAVAKLGDSDSLRIGEWVVAAGNPFGLRDTVTAGIVSAKGRSNVRIAEYEDFIQTDAAINPGNSGGPLIDLHGRVVGINTAIATRHGGSDGVGFAIPVNMAKSVMDSLINNGQVVRGWLGVAIQPLDDAMAKSFDYDSTEGALISDVLPNSPAQKAGLEAGDIVVKFDNKKIHDMQQLRNMAAATEPGTRVQIGVIRNGQPKTLKLKVTQRDDEVAMAANHEMSDELGMAVANMTPQIAQALDLDADAQGVVVTQVEPGGLAYMAGIEPGNLIVNVQGEAVGNVSEFQHELKQHDLKAGVRLAIKTGDTQHFIFLRSRGD